MWVTSFEKSDVSKKANNYLKGRPEYADYYLQYDPRYPERVMVTNTICWLIRERLKTLPSDITFPKAMEDGGMTSEWLRYELEQRGVPYDIMPSDSWLLMMIHSIIPSFLQRKKDYVVNYEEDESLPPIIFGVDDVAYRYAIMKGECCRYKTTYKNWDVYKGIYALYTYPRLEFNRNNGFNYDWTNYKNCYRAINADGTVLKGNNLADIKSKISSYERGEEVE